MTGMDKDFRRFFCEVVCRPAMVIAPMLCVLILHDAGYHYFYREVFGRYGVGVIIALNWALWHGMLPTFILMALLPLRLIKAHYLLVPLIPGVLFGFGASTHFMLCVLLSLYWLTGCLVMFFIKYAVYRRIAQRFNLSPL